MKKLNSILKISAVISLAVLLVYSYYKIPKLTYGFAAYYTFSKILYEGEDLSRGYEADFFNQKINEYGFKNIYDLYNIIPTNAFVYLPFVWLNPESAKISWGFFSLVLLLAASFILLKAFNVKFKGNAGLIFLITIFLWHPVYENIALGQMYIFLFFLFSLSLYGLSKNKNLLNLSPVILSILFKGYGVFYFLWLLITKRFKVFIISSLLLIALIIITLPVIHFSVWKTFIDVTSSTLGRFNEDSNVVYQTINGFIRHLFVYHKELNPNSIFKISSDIVFVMVIIINLTVVGLLLLKSGKIQNNNEFSLLSLSAIIASSVTTAPMAEEYTYVLFIPLMVALGCILFRVRPENPIGQITVPKILYVFAVLEIMMPIHYKHMQDYSFPAYLIAYPKLYGGLILLSLFFTLKIPAVQKIK
jgi:hypothetical protein